MRFLFLTATLATTALLAAARPAVPSQTAPLGLGGPARADRKVAHAHTVRRDASLTKTPKVVRERDKLTRRKEHKHRL